MPDGWEWDATLFAGSARYYERGRLPYPEALRETFAAAADLRGAPRLIDVGCGPGKVALQLAPVFAEVVGLDSDHGMIAEAERLAAKRGARNLRWVTRRAEELPAGLGKFRYATFAASSHWMDRPLVAARIHAMLESGGAFVHVGGEELDAPAPIPPLPHPAPPAADIAQLVALYLGPERRAGQGVLRSGTPRGERHVLEEAGFEPPDVVRVAGGEVIDRSVDDVVANVFSMSGSAPHLFGDRLAGFERDLRDVLAAASDGGLFSEQVPDLALVFYRRP